MGQIEFQSPVIDSVPKVNDEVAVGEDLEFQRKWWAFERGVWIVFGIILLLTLLGAFGRGWLAKAEQASADGELTLKYDRIQRTGTPSDLTIVFGPGAVHQGAIHLNVSESLISKLGMQRISPQPERSTLNGDGVTYTFPAMPGKATIVLSLQPSGPGLFKFRTALAESGSEVQSKVMVVP